MGSSSTYHYTLEPYKGPDSRHTCPACGATHKFARYIDTATGEYLAEDCGRCDREDSCGYHLKPREYFSQHPERASEYKHLQRKKRPALVEAYSAPIAPELYTIPKATLRQLYDSETRQEENRTAGSRRWPTSRLLYGAGYAEKRADLIRREALATLPEASTFAAFLFDLLGQQTYCEAVKRYHLASWRGAAVFWYIDKDKRIRSGKAMYYHENGHRNKNYNPFYMHSILASQAYLPEGWHLRRCLFGEHLLANDPTAPIALVEAEKTAVIASALTEGPALWLAAGGLQYLNETSCAALKGRKVIAYPDLQAFDKWQDKLQRLADTIGFNVTLSTLLEDCATAEQRQRGLDIADFLIDEQQKTTY